MVGRRVGPSEHQQWEGERQGGPARLRSRSTGLHQDLPLCPHTAGALEVRPARPAPMAGSAPAGVRGGVCRTHERRCGLSHQRAVEGREGCRLCRGASSSSSWGQDQGSAGRLWAPGLVSPRCVSACGHSPLRQLCACFKADFGAVSSGWAWGGPWAAAVGSAGLAWDAQKVLSHPGPAQNAVVGAV